MKGCQGVLQDLQTLVQKYESLGFQTKRTWDRLRWHSDDVAELRARLTSSTVLLTAYISTSQIVVKKQLDRFMQEYKDGKHEASVITTKTVDSLSMDEKQAWRAIRKELEGIGVSVTAFDANKIFILEWFQEAMNNGAFDEQQDEDDSISLLCEEDIPLSVNDLDPAAGDYDLARRSNGTETVGPKQPEMQSTPSQNSLIESQQSNRVGLRQDMSTDSIETSPQKTPQSQPLLHPLTDRPPNIVNKNSKLGIHENEQIASPTPKQGPLPRKRAPRVARIISRILEKGKALHRAAATGDVITVRKLISDPSVDLEWRNKDRDTPLYTACAHRNFRIAKLLLQGGANANIVNDSRTTILEFLLLRQITHVNLSLIRLLLERGADPNFVIGIRKTPLFLTARDGRLDIARLLLENGADVNLTSYSRETPILVAVREGLEDMVKLLLEYGADINLPDRDGDLPLHAATEVGLESIFRVLVENGANLNLPNRHGEVPLVGAVRRGQEDIVRLLLEHGAYYIGSFNPQSDPMLLALGIGNMGIVRLLREYDSKD